MVNDFEKSPVEKLDSHFFVLPGFPEELLQAVVEHQALQLGGPELLQWTPGPVTITVFFSLCFLSNFLQPND